jgi:hypothetical protein
MSKVDDLFARLKAMKPEDQLRLAAELIARGEKTSVGWSIVQYALNEHNARRLGLSL